MNSSYSSDSSFEDSEQDNILQRPYDSKIKLFPQNPEILNRVRENVFIYSSPSSAIVPYISRSYQSQLAQNLVKKLNFQTFEEYKEKLKEAIESESRLQNDFFKYSITEFKTVLSIDTLEPFVTTDPVSVSDVFANHFSEELKLNIATVIDMIKTVAPLHDITLLRWIASALCKFKIDYSQICSSGDFKAITLAKRVDRFGKKKQKNPNYYWIVLDNNNEIKFLQSHINNRVTPDVNEIKSIKCDVISFNKKGTKMKIHTSPASVACILKPYYKFDAIEREQWEYHLLRSKKVPFFQSIGYFTNEIMHDIPKSYIEATENAIQCPLTLVVRALMSTKLINKQNADSIFDALITIYSYLKRIQELLTAILVEGVVKDPNNSRKYISRNYLIDLFLRYFFNKFSQPDYFSLVIDPIIREINRVSRINLRSPDADGEILMQLLEKTLPIIMDNYDAISPQIRHFLSISQNFVIITFYKKGSIYNIITSVFFKSFIIPSIKEEDSGTPPTQVAIEYTKLLKTFLKLHLKQLFAKYPALITFERRIIALQRKALDFIFSLPSIPRGLEYPVYQITEYQNSIQMILQTISDNNTVFKIRVKKAERTIENSPMVFGVAHFLRMLASTRQSSGLVDSLDDVPYEEFAVKPRDNSSKASHKQVDESNNENQRLKGSEYASSRHSSRRHSSRRSSHSHRHHRSSAASKSSRSSRSHSRHKRDSRSGRSPDPPYSSDSDSGDDPRFSSRNGQRASYRGYSTRNHNDDYVEEDSTSDDFPPKAAQDSSSSEETS